MKLNSTRERIVEAADQLFYLKGFEQTSFADIAEAVSISRGNFYYHFKTKDEILDAVIKYRQQMTKNMLEEWELEDNPVERIRNFINILNLNRNKIKKYGCPVGTLCTELAKLNHASQGEANKLFTLFRTWLRKQFSLLNLKSDADALAMHLIARSQGVATLANAFHDEKFINKEIKLLETWLEACVKNRQVIDASTG